MPRDANGSTQPLPGTIVSTGDTVLPSQHNPMVVDVYAMMTQSLSRDGQGGMRANLDFSTFKGVNLANGTANGDAVNKAQLDASATLTTVGAGRVLRLSNGFIAQIFTANNVSGFDIVNFPQPFSAAVLGIWGNPVFSPPGGLFIGISCTPINLIGFNAHARSIANGGTVVLATNAITQYLAIGI